MQTLNKLPGGLTSEGHEALLGVKQLMFAILICIFNFAMLYPLVLNSLFIYFFCSRVLWDLSSVGVLVWRLQASFPVFPWGSPCRLVLRLWTVWCPSAVARESWSLETDRLGKKEEGSELLWPSISEYTFNCWTDSWTTVLIMDYFTYVIILLIYVIFVNLHKSKP